MTITKKQEGSHLRIALEGRLDTTTAPELKKELEQLPKDVETLTFDFANLEYVSSAGLRVLLLARRALGEKAVKVENANELVQEVFSVTGFSDLIDLV